LFANKALLLTPASQIGPYLTPLVNMWLMWIMERLYSTLQDVVVVTCQPIQIRQMSWAEGKRLKQILGLFMLQIFQQAQHMELVLGRLKIFMLL